MRGFKRCVVLSWMFWLTVFLLSSPAAMLVPAIQSWGLEGPHPNDPYQAGDTVFYNLSVGGTRTNPTQNNTQSVNVYLSRVMNSTASPAVLLPPGVTASIPGNSTGGPVVHGQGKVPSTFAGSAMTAGTYYIVYSAVGSTGSDVKSSRITIAVPDISVEQPVGTVLTDGTSTVTFPAVAVNGTSTNTFLIRNSGTGTLAGIAATIDGTHSADFAVMTVPATSVAAGNSTSMVLRFSPKAAGNRTGRLRVASSVAGAKNPFDINLTGVGAAAPLATTGGISNVTTTSAVIGGTVNAMGTSTTASFEYGPTSSYGASVAGSPSPVTGSSNTAVTAELTGLTPGTTYHYRLNATSIGGTVNGSDGEFTTAVAVPSMPGWGHLASLVLVLCLGVRGFRLVR